MARYDDACYPRFAYWFQCAVVRVGRDGKWEGRGSYKGYGGKVKGKAGPKVEEMREAEETVARSKSATHQKYQATSTTMQERVDSVKKIAKRKKGRQSYPGARAGAELKIC
ncbi:hypothetical protein LTR56_016604 [Elasticomyces elasticus]|nr:hypothetical protein LTR56_016604 [Elasticomyces elasticus]KAK3650635.1 hypothetical protein LTR22_012493 [Elasticomyces elasticus]KAK4913968.1 hypothetical protein LTR49_017786 [Elasticomyces elasticus]KAK5753132.1 hypothetical protein LTS12_016811 [Elasticomyces elasticus]